MVELLVCVNAARSSPVEGKIPLEVLSVPSPTSTSKAWPVTSARSSTPPLRMVSSSAAALAVVVMVWPGLMIAMSPATGQAGVPPPVSWFQTAAPAVQLPELMVSKVRPGEDANALTVPPRKSAVVKPILVRSIWPSLVPL